MAFGCCVGDAFNSVLDHCYLVQFEAKPVNFKLDGLWFETWTVLLLFCAELRKVELAGLASSSWAKTVKGSVADDKKESELTTSVW